MEPIQKLIGYIKGQLNAGEDLNSVKANLMNSGFLPSEIDAALSVMNAAPEPVVAPAKPIQPVGVVPTQNIPVNLPVQEIPVTAAPTIQVNPTPIPAVAVPITAVQEPVVVPSVVEKAPIPQPVVPVTPIKIRPSLDSTIVFNQTRPVVAPAPQPMHEYDSTPIMPTMGQVKPQSMGGFSQVPQTVIPQTKKSHLGLIIFILVVIFLVLSGTVYAYFYFYAPNPDSLVSNSLIKLAQAAVQKNNSITTLELTESASAPEGNSIAGMPFTESATFKMVAKSDIANNKGVANISIDGKFKSGIMSVAIDGSNILDFVWADKALYVKLNKIPEEISGYLPSSDPDIIFLKNEIVGKWVKLQESDLNKLGQYSTDITSGLDGAENNINKDKVLAAYKNSPGLFTVSQTLPGDPNNKSLLGYELTLNVPKFVDFFIAVSKDDKTGKLPNGVDEATMRSRLNQSLAEATDFFNANDIKETIEIWINRYSRLPEKLAINVIAKDIKEQGQIIFDNISGQASVGYEFPDKLSIDTPQSSVTVDELMDKYSQITQTKNTSKTTTSKQTSSVSTVVAPAKTTSVLSPSLAVLQKKYTVADETGAKKVKDYFVKFGADTYYLSWSQFTKDFYALEFLKNTDDYNNFSQMVTVQYHNVGGQDYFDTYTENMKTQHPNSVQTINNDGDNIIKVYLVSPKKDFVEYNLQRVTVLNETTARVILFTKKYTYPKTDADKQKILSDVDANSKIWDDAILGVNFEIK